MILDTTNKVVELILSAALTTNNCEWSADFVDTINGSTFSPGSNNGISNGTTLVIAVAAPAASTQRAVRAFTFYNADTVNTTVTVRIFDGANRSRIVTSALAPGASLVFTPEAGWAVLAGTPGQIIGTSKNDNAAAGNVGEFLSVLIPVGSALPMTTGVALDLASLTLTPGDWDLWASLVTNPAGTTVTAAFVAGLNTTANTLPTLEFRQYETPTASAGNNASTALPIQRILLAASTTYRAVGLANFITSTCALCGFISARRAR